MENIRKEREIEIAFNLKIYEGWINDIEEIRNKYNLPDPVVAKTFLEHNSRILTASKLVGCALNGMALNIKK